MEAGISALRNWLAAALIAGCAALGGESLEGTSWQLVHFQGGDGKVLVPDDRSKYTLAFNADGTLNARIDCNRGRGGWKSPEKGRLELGAMAVTRAMCPPGSIDHEIAKRLPHVRSYLIKDGRLFLSMMADGGTFELEPVR
jgi:para-nitrobenzyl esterase